MVGYMRVLHVRDCSPRGNDDVFTQMSENADDVSSQLSSVIEDLAQGDTDVRDKQIRDD